MATLAFQNQTKLSVGYDALRRVTTHRWDGPKGLLVGFGYTYDRANNRLSQEKLHNPANSELYGYRSDYELTSFARGTLNPTKTVIVTPTATVGALQNQTWSLDGTGNWTANTHTTAGVTGTENRTSSNVNEIATLSGSPYGKNVNFTYQFDSNGNLLDDGVRIYKWDALNRLHQVFRKSDGLLIAEYSYAQDNRRFRKEVANGGLDGTAANGTTDFYWSGWQTIEERDGSDAVTQQYVYGTALNELWTLDDRRGGITVAQLNGGNPNQRTFYHTDVLGSVYALTNERGNIVVGFQYDAYGVPTEFGQGKGKKVTFGSNVVIVGTTVPANPYGYTGYYRDAESFLHYARERYYVVDQGGFLSRDPRVTGDESNRYRYVHNNPATWTDPSGLMIPGWWAFFFRSQPKPLGPVSKIRICNRGINKEGAANSFEKGCLGTANICGHAYVDYGKDQNGRDRAYGAFDPNAKKGALADDEAGNAVLLPPSKCYTCYTVSWRNLQNGIGKGKKGTDATDDEIWDCIKNHPLSEDYSLRYNCFHWAYEATRSCGLICESPPKPLIW